MKYVNAVTVFTLALAGAFVLTGFAAILPYYFGHEPLLDDKGVTLIALPIGTAIGILAARKAFRYRGRLSFVYYCLAAVTVLSVIYTFGMPMDGCRRRGGEPARQVVCRNNLKLIGLALRVYAEDFGNHYPLELRDLYRNYVTDERLFECPSGPGKVGYVWVPGLTAEEDPSRIVAFDRKGNHKDGRNILFLDGHVEWKSELHFQSKLQEQPNADLLRRLDAAHFDSH